MRPPSCTSPASITTSGARPGRAGVSCTAPPASIAIPATQNTGRKITVTVAIERLTDLQPERLAPLIAESEQHGLRFVRRALHALDGHDPRKDRDMTTTNVHGTAHLQAIAPQLLVDDL